MVRAVQQPCYPYFLDLLPMLTGYEAELLSHTEKSELASAASEGRVQESPGIGSDRVCLLCPHVCPLPLEPGRHSHMD